ncbi:hypothetical protein FQN54_008900 [Arachnomyces sp. PD_36]|nr:hypothetical protein FQN54_008900 [Arachnomyces sp. PD_36]
MASPRVLLLGGHGKISLHLTPLLLARSWNVTSVIRNPDQSDEILKLGEGKKGKVDVLISSLDDIKSESDARSILDKVKPEYVVWSAGAGGKGGADRTYAVDQDAAKHFISTSFSTPSITKFLLVSHSGSRRNRASWMSDEAWAGVRRTFEEVLPDYCKAKLEADEFMVAAAKKRADKDGDAAKFQSICLRPGTLSDDPATRKVQLGKTSTVGKVSREDVAIVADKLLARGDTRGWYDLLGGDEPVDEAIKRVVRDKVDAIEGEDLEKIYSRF